MAAKKKRSAPATPATAVPVALVPVVHVVPGADHPRPEARPDYRPPAAYDAKAAP